MDKIDRVKKVVCYVTKMSEKELLSKSRKRHIVDNRRMAFVICKDILELSWTKIAKEFNLNHASIIHHYNKHKDLMAYDDYYNSKYNDILEVFKLQIDYVEPKELIREIVNIKKQRYNNYLKQKLRENEGKGQSETTFIGPSI
jgi:hypothetical protein|tara:strand:- start:478 stop:906 length:429 start_codon:yes stop_codon:yes gene_type:complete